MKLGGALAVAILLSFPAQSQIARVGLSPEHVQLLDSELIYSITMELECAHTKAAEFPGLIPRIRNGSNDSQVNLVMGALRGPPGSIGAVQRPRLRNILEINLLKRATCSGTLGSLKIVGEILIIPASELTRIGSVGSRIIELKTKDFIVEAD